MYADLNNKIEQIVDGFKNIEVGHNGLLKTVNRMGYMLTDVDYPTQKFIEFAQTSPNPVMEIGCAYGFVTQLLLHQGAKVIANDIDPIHLQTVRDCTHPDKLNNLQLLQGAFPNDIDLEQSSISGVLTLRILHFLQGEDIITGVKKIFNWLHSGGKFFIVTETPYLTELDEFIPLYEERKRANMPWPGMVEDTKKYFPQNYDELPAWINFIDKDYMQKVLEEAGFIIEESECFRREIGLNLLYKDLPNFLYIIARKP